MRSTDRGTPTFHAGSAAVLACVLLSACATTHRAVDVDHSELSARSSLNCRIELTELVDSVGARTHVGTGGDTWEVSGITDTIRQQIADWQPGSPTTDKDIELSLELARAYYKQKTTQNFFHTALVARTEHSEDQVFRGMADMTSWFGNKAEYMATLNESLNQALGQLHHWLSDRCERS